MEGQRVRGGKGGREEERVRLRETESRCIEQERNVQCSIVDYSAVH